MSSLLKNPVQEAVQGAATKAVQDTAATVIDISKAVEQLLDGLASQPQQVLHVYSYSDQTRAIEEKSCISFKSLDVNIIKLSDVRDLLVSEKVLEPTLLWSSFCNQRGAKVLDSTDYNAYLAILNEKSSEVGDIAEDNSDVYRVYLKSEKLIDYEYARSLFDRGVRASIDKKTPDLPVASKPKAAELPTSFSHNIFLNPTTTFSIVHPADMSETQWNVVLRNNALLNAYRVVDAGKTIGKIVERSMHPAFALKTRLFQNYEISASAASDSIAKKEQMLRVPRYRIEDDSYIEQFEKTSSVSRAIAQSSLSQLAAELAIEGGAFGFSASASASYGEDKSSSSSETSSEDSRVMTITYNFPRVVLELDASSLELSEECKFDLAAVSTAADVDSFKNKYGRFYPTRIELGGRLHSSEKSSSTSTADKDEQAKSMRAAAALSFSSAYVQASAKASYGQSSDSSSQNSAASATKSISWEAKGGDTLLCNDPPAWAYTVGSFYNWRAVKQSRVLALEDVIASIPGCQDIKQKFADILRTGSQTKPTSSQVAVKFKLIHRWHGKTVTIKPSQQGPRYREEIFKRTKTNVITEERRRYLNELSEAVAEGVPLEVQTDSSSNSNQKLCINVESTETNGKNQVKYNYPYRIYNSGDGDVWLGASPVLQGYLNTSLIWAGTRENATTFQFTSNKAGNKSVYVQEGDEVFIDQFDKEGNAIRAAAWLHSPEGCIGTHIDSLQDPEYYWFIFSYSK
ncbi:uncharacterized protein BO72DRAFT_442716 [Aspergillus fijiensis CBS 313.89]|uniref:MACPF-like domain-containing protein n=1 Tax=Aspergillus fijiensis CBS 313.89 TaxID=1448319 RepID=A0A8G1RCA2_9EURO|nr:uncharacterized protein BO72DRAFT_442716 [Aspergillus fijiensis CBS 313.89]RAK71122.1 hypothetical protein BO72DRAFT_442716 [Aspergillus fijiensis CBS 313.89]